MLMEKERQLVVDYGNRMTKDGLTIGTAGNISICDRDHGRMVISPSGIPYGETKPEDIVVMDLEGHVLEGKNKPSSEHELHAVIYRTRPDLSAVVHTHSMYCTTLACMGQNLVSVHYALADAHVDTIPLVEYHTFGTAALAEAVAKGLEGETRGLLLANHGMVACGDSIRSAYGLALTMEWCAQVQWRCLAAGTMNVLTKEQMADVMEAYKSYGQVRADGTRPQGYNG